MDREFALSPIAQTGLTISGMGCIVRAMVDTHGFDLAAWIGGGVILLIVGLLGERITKLGLKLTGGTEMAVDMTRSESTEDDVEISDELDRAAEAETTVEVNEDEVVKWTRFVLASQTIEMLLRSDGSVLDGCRLHLFLWDNDRNGLVDDAFDPEKATDRPWQANEGAVGKAWATGEFQLAIGDAARDGTHNLDRQRQERHADLCAVAATPIVNAADKVIAVLSASERSVADDETSVLAGDDAAEDMLGRALMLARVLVDQLGWYDDEPS